MAIIRNFTRREQSLGGDEIQLWVTGDWDDNPTYDNWKTIKGFRVVNNSADRTMRITAYQNGVQVWSSAGGGDYPPGTDTTRNTPNIQYDPNTMGYQFDPVNP